MKIMINDQILHQSNIFSEVLTTQILLVLSVVPNIYQHLVRLVKIGDRRKGDSIIGCFNLLNIYTARSFFFPHDLMSQ